MTFYRKISMQTLIYAYVLFMMSCTSGQIIRDDEYTNSVTLFRQKEIRAALETFPKKESHGFLTDLEKNWIRFWIDQSKPEELVTQSNTVELRQMTSIVHDASAFLVGPSEDGYYPAEHEIIFLHLLAGFSFIDQKKYAEARVEAKKASELLQRPSPSTGTTDFDDPALRIMMSSLWWLLGEWPEAQVDLRRAHEMSNSPYPENFGPNPKMLSLYLNSLMPESDWSKAEDRPVFIYDLPKLEGAEFIQPNSPWVYHFSTEPWIKWHLRRSDELRDVMIKSNYMAQYLSAKTKRGLTEGLGFLASGTVKALGVIAGTAIVAGGLYIAAQAHSGGELPSAIVATGFLVGQKSWKAGDRITSDVSLSAKREEENDIRNIQVYRYMRFLPASIRLSNQQVLSNSSVVTKTLFSEDSLRSLQMILN